MKLALYTTNEACETIVDVEITHMTMFEKGMMKIQFMTVEEQTKFIAACIKYYVLIQVQGNTVSIVPESSNYQRVRFRFDS